MEIISIILSFIVVLTVIVFVHEFGHFWVARRSGVKIEIFSIGFGRELFGFNDSQGTRWKFCLVPMGGYIKMFGDKNAASQTDENKIRNLSQKEKDFAFSCKSLLTKSAIVVAGPLANYLFSAIVFSSFFLIYGYPNSTPVVTRVIEHSPASKAGIYPGDTITEINNKKIESFDDIRNIMSLNLGEEVYIRINDQKEYKIVTPEKKIEKDILGNEVKSYKLGIMTDTIIMEKQNIFSAIKLSIFECYKLSIITLKSIGQMIIGERSSKELGGPIKIAQYSAKSAEAGIKSLLWFMALLSVNLGLVNLFPIPALDGGHLLIYLVEASFGKKIASKIQNYGFPIGIILLLMLTMFVTLNDLNSLFK